MIDFRAKRPRLQGAPTSENIAGWRKMPTPDPLMTQTRDGSCGSAERRSQLRCEEVAAKAH